MKTGILTTFGIWVRMALAAKEELMPSLFFSYCHVDEELRDRLEKQFATLKRQGIIEAWHDQRIGAGDEIDKSIDARI